MSIEDPAARQSVATARCNDNDNDNDNGRGQVATDGGVVAARDPATVARETPLGEEVTLVYQSARSDTEVTMAVERARVTGTSGEFRRRGGEDRPATHRVTVDRSGGVWSVTSQRTKLGELVEVRR